MHARTTSFRSDPCDVASVAAAVRERSSAVQAVDGCLGLSLLTDRFSGRCVLTSWWADDAADVDPPPGVSVDETLDWSAGVRHQVREAPPGAATRVIRAAGPGGLADRVVAGFRGIVVPRADDLPGFCEAVLLLDDAAGRLWIAATYDSRQTMSLAKGQALAIREQFVDRVGLHVTEVAAYDLAVADLRVPEPA